MQRRVGSLVQPLDLDAPAVVFQFLMLMLDAHL